MNELELTCTKPFSQSRTVFQTKLVIDLEVGDTVSLYPAVNIPDNENYYWVMSINQDTSYADHNYGYLVHIDEITKNEYFEEYDSSLHHNT